MVQSFIISSTWSTSGQCSNDALPIAGKSARSGFSPEYDNWVLIQLDEEHAGVLTRPAYLIRFQTNRGRADRFYTNFLCQPFEPPEEGLPVSDGRKMRQSRPSESSGLRILSRASGACCILGSLDQALAADS